MYIIDKITRIKVVRKTDLPEIDEILYAVSEVPLGEGAEAQVFKIHTNPNFTVRKKSHGISNTELAQYLKEADSVLQPDIFGERNFAQTVAYFDHPKLIDENGPFLTINRYCPGFSFEVYKPGRPKPDAEEALTKTRLLSEKMLDIPDRAMDIIYDDLHFLSSKKNSLDVGGGLFTNTGNVLYSAVDQRWFIIDLQPFIVERPGIPKGQTKGFNTPLYLTRGLLPGALCYKDEHSKDPELIKYRTMMVDRIISGAERNGLNDIGGYLAGNMDKMLNFWELQLKILNVPEKYQDNMLTRIGSVRQEHRYATDNTMANYIRVSGKGMCS